MCVCVCAESANESLVRIEHKGTRREFVRCTRHSAVPNGRVENGSRDARIDLRSRFQDEAMLFGKVQRRRMADVEERGGGRQERVEGRRGGSARVSVGLHVLSICV